MALEILTLLLENATSDSVEIAVGFMKECGQKLSEVSPKGVEAIYATMRNILHQSQVDVRVQYMIEVSDRKARVIAISLITASFISTCN